MRYAMIDQLRKQHPFAKLCALLDVAKCGYQAWSMGKVVSPSKLEDMHLLVVIRAAHQRGRGTHKKKFKVTTDSKHTLPIAPSLLNRQCAVICLGEDIEP